MCQEGFKRLNQLLDSDALLHTLDVTTLRIRPSDRGVPGVCHFRALYIVPAM